MFGMLKMLPILLILGGAGYGYHKVVINEKDNRINQQQMDIAAATQQNVALQTAAQTNINTIKNMEKQMKAQAQAFASLTTKSARLEQEKTQYLSVFKRHNLTKTARARPGFMEPKINSGTAKVFRQVEADSRELDEADDTSAEQSYDTPE
jgi:cell division protein FtsB